MQRQPIGPIKLPSGREVHVVEPLGRDRMEIMSRALAEGRQGEMMFLISSYWLPAKCLVNAEGKFLAADYTKAYDDWPDKDLQFFRSVFDELFGFTSETSLAARAEAARFLPRPPTSPST